jgi:hypothetical protein
VVFQGFRGRTSAPDRATEIVVSPVRVRVSPSCRTARRRWTDDRLRREIETFLPEFDVWPPYPWFRATGRRGLWQAIAKRDGPERFAADYGLPYTRNGRGLSEAQVRTRLRAALRGTDLKTWPPKQWLRIHGGSDLVTAIDHAGGRARWALELGLPFRDRHGHRPGERCTPATTAAARELLLAGRHTWPSRRELTRPAWQDCTPRSPSMTATAPRPRATGLPPERARRRPTPPGRAPRAGAGG